MKSQVQKPTTQSDKDFIAECVVRFYKENPEEERANPYDQIRESVHELLDSENNHQYFLIKADNELAGFIQIMQNKNTLEIILIYLLPDFRRQGLGKQAVNNILEQYEDEDINSIKTEINIHNDASQNFFADLGFEKQSLMYIKE
jgi:ribosomal protein S18 acetylase RimI-like enzyme